jgi:hypothetical protein
MTRSTKTDKARQLNAAFAMLQRNMPLSEAMQRLAGEFDLSERQAYRYLEEAAHLELPVEVTEATVPITLTYASSVCEKQWADDRRDCYTRIGCVSECSEKAWLSRAQRSARFKFTLSICLIVCTNQNSSRPTVFLCPFGNVSLAAV